MSRGQKIALVLGLLLLALLALWVLWRDNPPPRCPGGRADCDRAEIQPPAWLAALGGRLAGPSARARPATGPRLQVAAQAEQPFRIEPAPGDGPDPRTLKLELVRGAVELRLHNATPMRNPEVQKQEQAQRLPDGARDTPNRLSYAIGRAGATLTVACRTSSPCELRAE